MKTDLKNYMVYIIFADFVSTFLFSWAAWLHVWSEKLIQDMNPSQVFQKIGSKHLSELWVFS